MLAWDAFSRDWATDIVEQLKLDDVRAMVAPYGELPDLSSKERPPGSRGRFKCGSRAAERVDHEPPRFACRAHDSVE